MTKVDLNDLPNWSPWPSRLLGISSWEVPHRTVERVDLEYDRDKYAKCLAYYTKSGGTVTTEAVKQFERGGDPNASLCVSLGNDLVLMTLNEVQSRYDEWLVETMRQEIEQSTTIVELGCGYGYNLGVLQQQFHDKRFLGGECSQNAVRLAAGLFRKDPRIQVFRFNFYDSTYKILKEVQQPITIFTLHAIEQLPRSMPFFQALAKDRGRVRAVFHFEPVFELHDPTLLGLMRRRYAEVNNYNLDLLSELQQRKVHIVRTEADVIGSNPLNPTSIIQWEYKT